MALEALREVRLAARLTQGELARALGTTQQTVARWEAGKAEPNVAALRELAMIFGTTVDALVGSTPVPARRSPTTYAVLSNGSQDPCWGHAGVSLSGEGRSRWFPINGTEARRLERSLDEGRAAWLTFATLDNRLVAVNVGNTRSLCLLDREADRPPGDWDVRWGEADGVPVDFYRVLDGYFVADAEPLEPASPTLIAVVREAVEQQSWDRAAIIGMTRQTTVSLADGTTVSSAAVAADDLWQLLVAIEHDDVPLLVRVDAAARQYYPAARIALVQMPRLYVLDAGRRDMESAQAEADDDIAFT